MAVGGAVGALGRYLVGQGMPVAATDLGIVVANLTGAFVLGLLVSRPMSDRAGLFWRTGVLGAFTTFSAMAVEATELGWLGGPYLLALAGAGWLVAWLGLRVGGRVWSPVGQTD